MAETFQQVRDRLENDQDNVNLFFTRNGEQVKYTDQERSDILDEWATRIVNQQLKEEAEALKKSIRLQAIQGLSILNDDISLLETTSPTLAATRTMLLRTDRILRGLIIALRDLNILESS